jgi:hypothetical protein
MEAASCDAAAAAGGGGGGGGGSGSSRGGRAGGGAAGKGGGTGGGGGGGGGARQGSAAASGASARGSTGGTAASGAPCGSGSGGERRQLRELVEESFRWGGHARRGRAPQAARPQAASQGVRAAAVTHARAPAPPRPCPPSAASPTAPAAAPSTLARFCFGTRSTCRPWGCPPWTRTATCCRRPRAWRGPSPSGDAAAPASALPWPQTYMSPYPQYSRSPAHCTLCQAHRRRLPAARRRPRGRRAS